jgi:hypothetical protein
MKLSETDLSTTENQRPEQIFSTILLNMTKKKNNMEHQISKQNIYIENLKTSLQNCKIDKKNFIERAMQVAYDLMNSPESLWSAYKEK